ncbi:MAG: cbb3-type cytochrome oxidase assembly protein CcoS [Pseudomonadota bacterium]|uniref:cbb3-type cytochrome oxidase assembly protein CcoS n=1 Tax=Thermomonas sp. TaxID=1971895 RepID=UPI003BCFB35F
MTILLFLIPISLILLGIAVLVFVWAVRSGQFEDLDTPALDILRDEKPPAATRAAAPSTAEERDAD